MRNDASPTADTFHGGSLNGSWVAGVGRRYMPGGTCPAPADCSGLPAVASGDQAVYADSFINLLGIVVADHRATGTTRSTARSCRSASRCARLYAADEYEFYMQDSWKLRDDLTVSAGLRYSLYSPPYEAQRHAGRAVGGSRRMVRRSAARTCGARHSVERERAHHVQPRRPGQRRARLLRVGQEQLRAARLGGVDADAAAGAARRLLASSTTASAPASRRRSTTGGSFGLSTTLDARSKQFNENNPAGAVPGHQRRFRRPAAPRRREASGDADGRRRRDHVEHRQLDRHAVLARLQPGGRLRAGRELQPRSGLRRPPRTQPADAARPGDAGEHRRSEVGRWTTSPPCGSWSTHKLRRTASPAWRRCLLGEHVPGRGGRRPERDAGDGGGVPGRTRRTTSPRCRTPIRSASRPVRRLGEFTFFTEQYDSLSAQSSIGRSEYDAMQLSLRKRFSRGHQFDLNYTLARAKDHGSEVERGGAFGNFGSGGYSGFLVNSWEPDLNYSYADFDVRHQINVNGLCELPFGEGRSSGRRGVGGERDHRRLVGRRHLPLDERLPVQRGELPIVLGDELEPPGQRGARQSGRAAGDSRRRRTRSAASQVRSPIRRRRARRSAGLSPAKPASATCCAATATSASTSASANPSSCRSAHRLRVPVGRVQPDEHRRSSIPAT